MKTLGAVGNLIREKTDAKERATLKGAEIAKLGALSRRNIKFSGADYDIEIVSMNAIEGGVEVFARAWDGNGQIGFGKDGSVDVERFRIFNPPILVADGTQTLTEDREGNPCLVDNFKEDVELAILQSLAHIIKVKKEKHGSERIVPGVVGNTTSTFYPAAGANAPVDGTVGLLAANQSWATKHDALTGDSADVNFNSDPKLRGGTVSDTWSSITRTAILFDTSSIPDTDVISSATLSLKGTSIVDTNFDQKAGIVGSTPAANNDITTADYDQFGTTRYASDIDLGSLSGSAYNDFALNATGIAAISKTSYSKFGVRLSSDIDNSPPAWVSSGQATFQFAAADTSGTDSDPKLVVEHAAPITTVSLSESVGIVERLTRAWTAPRAQSEVLVLQGESLGRTWNTGRNPRDVVSITETVGAFKGRIIDLLETLGINESLSRAWTVSRSFSETVSITEIIAKLRLSIVNIVEQIVIIETVTVNKVLSIMLMDVVDIIEYVRTPLNWIKRIKPSTLWTKRTKP